MKEQSHLNTTAVIPANSQIIDIKINVETAFNDTGADLLDIGVVGNSDLYVNDFDINATGSFALGAAGLCANWLDVGATDVQIAFIYNGATTMMHQQALEHLLLCTHKILILLRSNLNFIN